MDALTVPLLVMFRVDVDAVFVTKKVGVHVVSRIPRRRLFLPIPIALIVDIDSEPFMEIVGFVRFVLERGRI